MRTSESKERIAKAMPKRIEREKFALEKQIKALKRTPFACFPDLKSGLERIFQSAKFHVMGGMECTEAIGKRSRCRPRKDVPAAGSVKELSPNADKFTVDETAVRRCELASACFVIGTNAASEPRDDTAHSWRKVRSTEEVPNAYLKEQQGVERSFRFLKDPQYFAGASFLKNPKRIVALLTVMTFALLIHSFLQRKLRMNLKASARTIPNQKNKPTSRPTIRWVNQRFEGVDVIKVVACESVRFVYQALDEFVTVVLNILGPPYVARYTLAHLT